MVWCRTGHASQTITTYGLMALGKGDEHPAYTPVGVWHTLPFVTESPDVIALSFV